MVAVEMGLAAWSFFCALTLLSICVATKHADQVLEQKS
jgi:hypothetical protein